MSDLRVGAVRRCERPTDGCGDLDADPAESHGLLDRMRDPLRDVEKVGLGRPADHDRELVAPQAGHGVGLAHEIGQPLPDRREELVAVTVSERVVDLLELVQVQQQQPDARPVAAHPGQRLCEPIEEQRPVGQAREGVVERLVSDQLRRPLPIGHVGELHGDGAVGQCDHLVVEAAHPRRGHDLHVVAIGGATGHVDIIEIGADRHRQPGRDPVQFRADGGAGPDAGQTGERRVDLEHRRRQLGRRPGGQHQQRLGLVGDHGGEPIDLEYVRYSMADKHEMGLA